MNIVVVGMSKAGKTALSTSIFGADSSPGGTVTSRRGHFNGKEITIVDTPGFFGPTSMEDVKKCIELAKPVVQAILVVVKINAIEDDTIQKGINAIDKVFQGKGLSSMVLVFTFSDTLKGITIDEYVQNLAAPTREFIGKSQLKYVAVNATLDTTSDENKRQVASIMEAVQSTSPLDVGEESDLGDIDVAVGNVTICFAADSKVKVRGENNAVVLKSLKDLAVGDLVQSYDQGSNSITYSPVYFISHENEDDSDEKSELKELVYEGNDGEHRSLSIAAKHLVYATANDHPASPESPPTFPMVVEKVKIGDILWVANGNGQLCPRRVLKINEKMANVRHPLTLNHVIIVDDVLASVHMYNERLLRAATVPLRLLYKINPRLTNSWLSKRCVNGWDYVEKYVLE